jgi:hypothetical protein
MPLRSHTTYPRLQVELNEMRMDAKIDMLHRSGMIGQASSKVEKHSGGDSTRAAGLEQVSRRFFLQNCSLRVILLHDSLKTTHRRMTASVN